MNILDEKFAKLGVSNAPGQEVRQQVDTLELRGEGLTGTPVDFSHGDVDAFTPTPGALELFNEGVEKIGGKQAYTEYRGEKSIREQVAAGISAFTGVEVSGENGLIFTPGTQSALFLAMGSTVARDTKVAIVEPDYFANRKMTHFFEGQLVPIGMDYFGVDQGSGIDLTRLEDSFKAGVEVFLFSNPNNPTGVVYSDGEISAIAELANRHGVTVIADELYSRQVFDDRAYTHLCARGMDPDRLLTIMGPSKTESLSGYRLGTAFGSPRLIERMEKLQAIVSLRAAGYCQAVLRTWFNEPRGWLQERTAAHQAIRDDLIRVFRTVPGLRVRPTEAGSYLFPQLPPLEVSIEDFVKILRGHAGVTVTPGTQFGPQFTDSIRLNFSQDHAAAVAAVERICTMVERYRKSPVQ